MFERFTRALRDVVIRAQDEAAELGHDFLGTEHLLLGLAAGDDPILASLGADHEEMIRVFRVFVESARRIVDVQREFIDEVLLGPAIQGGMGMRQL